MDREVVTPDADVTTDAAVQIELFDPPMCCPTGLCGPTLDQTLLDVNQMVQALQAAGMRVERYQMMSHPQAYLKRREVLRLVREQGVDVLPITVVAGRLIKTGAYPTRQEIETALQEATGGRL